MTNYGNESLDSLQGADQVRKKPANLLGSSDVHGAFHTLLEVVANSFDELRAIRTDMPKEEWDKRADTIRRIVVDYSTDKVIAVTDFGRGIPLAFNTKPKEWKFNWHLVFSKLYAGGKYVDELDSVNSNYSRSLGTNGLGCTLAQYTSEFLKVISKREGKVYTANFYKGLALAHYYASTGEHYRVVIDVENPELYYEGAVVKAFDDKDKLVDVQLERFNPYEDARYKPDHVTATEFGLNVFDELHYKVKDQEGYVILEDEKPIERFALFQQLYHSVLSVEEDTTVNQVAGTFIQWRIDTDVFPDTDFTIKMIKDLLETQAYVNGAIVELNDAYHNVFEKYEGTTTHDYFHSLVGKENILGESSKQYTSTGIEAGKKYALEADFTVAFINEDPLVHMKHLLLHNTSVMSEEVHVVESAKALNDFFKKIAKAHNVALKQQDYSFNFAFKVETYSNVNATAFKNQTKRGVTNNYIGHAIYTNILGILEYEYKRRNPDLILIISKAVSEATYRAQTAQVKKLSSTVKDITKKKLDLSKVYSKCGSTVVSKKELIIVEGLSAKTAAADARDASVQSVFGIQGKLPNALKTPIEDLLQNEVVQMLIKVIGVGIDVADGNKATYNYKNLNYGKIIIMTDADEDGKQIRMLLFILIYVLMKDLVVKGHVFMLESPILGYPLAKDARTQQVASNVLGGTNHKYAYAFTLHEVPTMVEAFQKEGVVLSNPKRYKGLGSFDGSELHEAAMRLDNRRLVSLQFDTTNKVTREVIDVLFGKDYGHNRKEVILKSLGMQLKNEELQTFIEEEEKLQEEVLVGE